jgi:hypothetical protein
MNNFTPPTISIPMTKIPSPVVQNINGGWLDTSDDEPEECVEHGDYFPC